MRFIFFSKSMWNEIPRIRHQLAYMFIQFGHEVIFFEKPNIFPFSSEIINFSDVCSSIKIRRSQQLLHHQLRTYSIFSNINSIYEQISIRGKLIDDDPRTDDVIVNFNYDYYFLRKLFPNNKIITIINDDFVQQAKFRSGKHVENALEITCRISNHVLAVSTPLIEQINKYCSPHLFLPWSDKLYSSPVNVNVNDRNCILIWASFDKDFDLNILNKLSLKKNDFEFHLVGPTTNDFFDELKKLQLIRSNIKYFSPRGLIELDMNRYFCSLLPYIESSRGVKSVTACNKTFRLLSYGLPLITSGMPNYYKADAIFNCSSYGEVLEAINKCKFEFESIQQFIPVIVNSNQALNRYEEFMQILQ